jgi:16S rRNA (cytosine967-C5)-methyltransferase
MPVDPVRDAAVDVLLRVERGVRLDDSLAKTLRRKGGALSARGRRFLSQLVYGTVRHQGLCDRVYEPFLNQQINKLPIEIRVILRMGVYQSLFLNQVTVPAMVHTSVELAKKRAHAGLAKVTNAVLRKVPQSLDEITFPDPKSDPLAYMIIRCSTPNWLATRWINELGPATAVAVARASVEEAPMTARVNPNRTDLETLVAALHRAKFDPAPYPDVPGAFLLSSSGIIDSKAFQNGELTIQDIASTLPAFALDPAAGERILDCCAAPGTKSTQLAEMAAATVVATDLDRFRVDRILQNAERLGLDNLRCAAADANHPPFRDDTFDRVLLDAPCSGLGTLRRHPEIKWRLRPRTLRRLGDQQRELLRSAIGLCKNDGVIVYSVCTFTPEETEQVVEPFIQQGVVVPEDGPEWLKKWQIKQGTYRTLPGADPLDGFFLTRLRKRS